MPETNVELGDYVQDRITGFEGRIIGICTYITKCDQCLISPVVDKDKKWVDSHWIDKPRLFKLPGENLIQ